MKRLWSNSLLVLTVLLSFTPALSLNTAKAATNPDVDIWGLVEIADTVTVKDKDEQLYDVFAKPVSRSLGKGTGWFADRYFEIDNNIYYRVSRDEYVNAKDVNLTYSKFNKGTIGPEGWDEIVDENGNPLHNRMLAPNSVWYFDKIKFIDAHHIIIRISKDEWINLIAVHYTK